MTPPLDKLTSLPDDAERRFRGTDPDVLREATARLRALGVDDEVVFSSDDPEEVMAYLASIPPCDATS